MRFDDRTTIEVENGRSSIYPGERRSARSMLNRKPYRTKEGKKLARRQAYKVDGTWYSPAPVLFHSQGEQGIREAYVTR